MIGEFVTKCLLKKELTTLVKKHGKAQVRGMIILEASQNQKYKKHMDLALSIIDKL